MGMVIEAAAEPETPALPHRVKFMTAAAPPPASVLEKIGAIGFDITHVYGLTEVYGPSTVLRLAGGLGRAATAGAGGEAGPPGRHLSGARRG